MRRTIVLTTLVLSLSLGSGAYAVSKIGPGDIKRDAVRSKHIKNGTVHLADLSAGARAHTVGPIGERGPVGPRGARGARGPRGSRGATGASGPFPATMPSGKAAQGTFALDHRSSAEGETADAAASFPFPLAAIPTPHVVAAGAAAPPECPGTAADPRAAAGHLCIYEAQAAGTIEGRTTYDPSKTFAAGTASTVGFALRYTLGLAQPTAHVHGTWAVTAP
jgi:hypothetical protein